MKKLVDIARQNGFDEQAFKTCLQNQTDIPLISYAARNDAVADENVEKAVFLFLHGEEIKAAHRLSELKHKAAVSPIIVTSGASLEGYSIKQYVDYISYTTTIQINRNELTFRLSSSLTQLREAAVWGLKEAAYDLHANAVVGVTFNHLSFEPESIGGAGVDTTHYYEPYMIGVTAGGNAVTVEKN